MEFTLNLNLHSTEIQQINQCRLHLQVLTLSDISTADGKHILPKILLGQPDRRSNWNWPRQPSSSARVWNIWRNFLQHFHRKSKLLHQLGPWLCRSHQKWEWLSLHDTPVIFHLCPENGKWYCHRPIERRNPSRHLRSTKVWFSILQRTGIWDPPDFLLPTTIEFTQGIHQIYFHSKPSAHPFPTTGEPPMHSLWLLPSTPPYLVNTAPFFQYLLGPQRLFLSETNSLA